MRLLRTAPRELWLVYLLKVLDSYGYFALSGARTLILTSPNFSVVTTFYYWNDGHPDPLLLPPSCDRCACHAPLPHLARISVSGTIVVALLGFRGIGIVTRLNSPLSFYTTSLDALGTPGVK